MDEARYAEILEENRRLKQRIFELEQQVYAFEERANPAKAGDQTQVTKVLKLLEQRDHTLDGITSELEQKKEELQRAIETIEERNRQLHLWISALSLFHRMLDDDAAAILGFNLDGQLLLYNQAAVQLFGDRITQWRLKGVEELDFAAVDPSLPVFLRETFTKRVGATHSQSRNGRTIKATVHAVGPGRQEPRGWLAKIQVT